MCFHAYVDDDENMKIEIYHRIRPYTDRSTLLTVIINDRHDPLIIINYIMAVVVAMVYHWNH